MPRLEDLALKRLPAADHITDALVRLARNAHGDELAGAKEPRQVRRIAFVVLAMHAGALRNEDGAITSHAYPHSMSARCNTYPAPLAS